MTEELKRRIKELEEELKNTKVNKRTEMAVGLLKAKIARLKKELEEKSSKSRKGDGFAVKKEGDRTIGLLGKPSVGKSTILTKLTNKESKIAFYEFTTLDVVPGLLNYKHVDFQILDLPGIIDRASDNRGFGKKVLSVVRSCDVILLIVDITKAEEELELLIRESYNSGIRYNKRKPNIKIIKTHYGGIKIISNMSEETLPNELVMNILRDNKLLNCEILINEKNLEVEDLIDAIYSNLVYKKAAIILNKSDLLGCIEISKIINNIKKRYKNYEVTAISAEQDPNLDILKEFIFKLSEFIFIYLKEPRREPDLSKPLVVKKGSTVKGVCLKIHKDFLKKFKYAKINGKSVKFDWQRVGLNHVVADDDIVEITIK